MLEIRSDVTEPCRGADSARGGNDDKGAEHLVVYWISHAVVLEMSSDASETLLYHGCARGNDSDGALSTMLCSE